jgi:succinate dehydrogenase / fumarate reductase iron-sulfur subunit
MEHSTINLKLKVWRQANSNASGGFQTYDANNISTEMSFLEMFDVVNEKLINDG